MIYTSYYENLQHIPSSVFPVAISSTLPSGLKNVLWLPELAPDWLAITRYKSTGDFISFACAYLLQLNRFSPKEVLRTLPEGDIVFLCYEKDVNSCHRSVFALWMQNALNEPVREWVNDG